MLGSFCESSPKEQTAALKGISECAPTYPIPSAAIYDNGGRTHEIYLWNLSSYTLAAREDHLQILRRALHLGDIRHRWMTAAPVHKGLVIGARKGF